MERQIVENARACYVAVTATATIGPKPCILVVSVVWRSRLIPRERVELLEVPTDTTLLPKQLFLVVHDEESRGWWLLAYYVQWFILGVCMPNDWRLQGNGVQCE